MTEAQRRADQARFHFSFWKALLDKSHLHRPQPVHDEGPNFRFSNGMFALSHTHAN